MDASEKISGELVVTCCDSAEVLEFVEEALDEVALAIEDEITRQWKRAAGMGRNDRGDLPLGEDVDEGIGVVCFVANQSRWIGIGEQWLCAD